MDTKSLSVSSTIASRSRRRKPTEVTGLLASRSLSDDELRRMHRALAAEGLTDVQVTYVSLEPSGIRALREGESGQVTVHIVRKGADGSFRRVDAGVELSKALEAARARGAAVTDELLADESMLSTSGMARLLGMSEEGVRQKRKRHEILGLEFAKRGIRYPAWQVLPDRKLLPSLPRLFEILGDDPWRLFRFLTQAHGETGGKSALDALKRGKIEGALAAAENTAMGAFS